MATNASNLTSLGANYYGELWSGVIVNLYKQSRSRRVMPTLALVREKC